MARSNQRYSQSQGMQLLETAVQELGPVFTIQQLSPLAVALKISHHQLTWLMSTLAASGRIEILKRGTYAVKGPFFVGDISPFSIAAALVQPMAISHWSALAQHGFTPQLPAIVQASTPRKVVTPEMRLGQARRPRGRAVWHALGVDVEYIFVQERLFFGHQRIWVSNSQQVSMTDPERTALDLIARSDIFGGMAPAIEILEQTLPRVQVPILVQYALKYDVGAVIKRLGWLLETFGMDSALLEPLQSFQVRTYYRLDPQAPPGRQYNSRWHIIDNLGKSPHA